MRLQLVISLYNYLISRILFGGMVTAYIIGQIICFILYYFPNHNCADILVFFLLYVYLHIACTCFDADSVEISSM